MIEPSEWNYHFSDHDIGDLSCFMCGEETSYPTYCEKCGGLIHRAIVNSYDEDYRGWTDIYFRCDICGKEWME